MITAPVLLYSCRALGTLLRVDHHPLVVFTLVGSFNDPFLDDLAAFQRGVVGSTTTKTPLRIMLTQGAWEGNSVIIEIVV